MIGDTRMSLERASLEEQKMAQVSALYVLLVRLEYSAYDQNPMHTIVYGFRPEAKSIGKSISRVVYRMAQSEEVASMHDRLCTENYHNYT